MLSNYMYVFEKANKDGLYKIYLKNGGGDVVADNGGTENNKSEAEGWIDGEKFEEGTPAAEIAD